MDTAGKRDNETSNVSNLREQLLAWLQHKWDESEEMRHSVVRFCSTHITFYRLHLAYFIFMAVLGTLLLWLCPKPHGRIALIDALFSVTSALCVTGLFSLRMGDLSQFDKAVLMFLMLLGSQVFMSLLPVYVRRFYFKSYIHKYMESEPNLGPATAPDDLERDGAPGHDKATQVEGPWKSSPSNFFEDAGKFLRFKSDPDAFQPSGWSDVDRVQGDAVYHTWSGEASRKEAQKFALLVSISKALQAKLEEEEKQNAPPKTSRGRGAGEDEIFLYSSTSKVLEHEALIYLSWLVPIYYLGILLTAILLIVLYFFDAPGALHTLNESGVNRIFFSMFTSVSAFANAGLSLLDASMVPFQKSVLLLLIYCVLILVGNTMFPACMRLFIWVLHRFAKGNSKLVFKYLLQHPRRCYTHLFPRRQTIWLVVTVMGFNAIELVAFCALDWRSSALEGLGAGYKVVDGVFQSVSTRAAGFQVAALAQLSSAMLVLYVGMMYIAAYPLFLSRQNSMAPKEVYDESDLGVYGKNWQVALVQSKLSWQARALLARDSSFLFAAVFLICIIHNQQTKRDPLNYSVFNIIFEVISAYGNVGLSVGYSCELAQRVQPNTPCTDVPYSFSGKWSPAAKAILVVVMFLGRHRGLPESIDSAIQLPRRKEFAMHRTRSLSRFRDPVLWNSFKGRRGPEAYNLSATSPHVLPQDTGSEAATGETSSVAAEPTGGESQNDHEVREEIIRHSP